MYILDIETRADKRLLPVFSASARPPRNLKDPEKIQEWFAKKEADSSRLMATDPDYADIVCIGVKEIGEAGFALTPTEFLEWLREPVREGSKDKRGDHETFITFNGKNFDLPVLIKYGIKNGLDLPYSRYMAGCRKWGTYAGHTDLLEVLANGLEYKSLDTYLRIYLGIEKETSGDDFFRKATDEELMKHCVQDLEYTEQLVEKFRPMLNI